MGMTGLGSSEIPGSALACVGPQSRVKSYHSDIHPRECQVIIRSDQVRR